MSLGYNPGSNGTYNLIGGSLSAQSIYVGYSGTGAFSQSGGTNAVPNNNPLPGGSTSCLYMGYNPGSTGTYSLSGTGLLSVTGTGPAPNGEFVGFSGAGAFTQSGGTNAISNSPYGIAPLGYAWVTTPVRPGRTASAARGS